MRGDGKHAWKAITCPYVGYELASSSHSDPPLATSIPWWSMNRKVTLILGCAYICTGLLLNPWVVARVGSPDGSLEGRSTILSVYALELLLIGFGVLTIRKGAATWVINLNLLCWTLAIALPVSGEAAIRMGIALKIGALRRPDLYADYASDDTYWFLQQKWNPRQPFVLPDHVHEVLGWSQRAPTATNPLGLFDMTRLRLAATGPKLLFFGDSFVRGAADREFQLPEYLNARLEDLSVADLGVGGYGLDQIYLMFEALRPQAAGSQILVGILAEDDLDRTTLSVRTSQKPYFALSADGGLLLRGVPIQRDQAAFFRRWSLPLHSYFLAFLRKRFVGSDEKIGLKQRISAGLLARFVSEAGAMGSEWSS
jgi:hypothetical protein